MAEAKSVIKINEVTFRNHIAASHRRSWHARLRHIKGVRLSCSGQPHAGSFAEWKQPRTEVLERLFYLSATRLTALSVPMIFLNSP